MSTYICLPFIIFLGGGGGWVCGGGEGWGGKGATILSYYFLLTVDGSRGTSLHTDEIVFDFISKCRAV